MSEYSVKNISKLPMLFPEKQGGLARSLMLKVLAKLQVGSLTLKEQGETLVFGEKTDHAYPSCTHFRISFALNRTAAAAGTKKLKSKSFHQYS